MKILICGAYGMLGSDLRDVLSSHDVIAAGSKDLDITDSEKVLEFVKENSPDIVINAAAYTAVDDCETHFDEAYQVNAIGPRNLAIACREFDYPLVHISTDYVFDGSKKTPLVEDDPIGPKSAYGKTKLEGAEFVLTAAEDIRDDKLANGALIYAAGQTIGYANHTFHKQPLHSMSNLGLIQTKHLRLLRS